jgi:hypothetical protein
MANKLDSKAEIPLALKDIGRTLTVDQVREKLEKLAKKVDRLENLAIEVRASARWLSTLLEVEEHWPNLAAKLEVDRENEEREANRKAAAKLSRRLVTKRIQ